MVSMDSLKLLGKCDLGAFFFSGLVVFIRFSKRPEAVKRLRLADERPECKHWVTAHWVLFIFSLTVNGSLAGGLGNPHRVL
jgi:hypothetical protein